MDTPGHLVQLDQQVVGGGEGWLVTGGEDRRLTGQTHQMSKLSDPVHAEAEAAAFGEPYPCPRRAVLGAELRFHNDTHIQVGFDALELDDQMLESSRPDPGANLLL